MTVQAKITPPLDPAAINRGFERATPQDIIAWAAKTFADDMIMSSSFGAESAVLLHMTTQIAPHTRIVFVDTGYLFPETHTFMQQLRRRLDLNVWTYRTRNDPLVYLSVHGETDPSMRRDIDNCCAQNKNEPFERAMAELAPRCWLRGIRRSQSAARQNRHFLEWSARYNCWVVSPLLDVSNQDAYAYLKQNDLPLHPLVDDGYLSIGCSPLTCTRKLSDGEHARAGRWHGTNRTECGLHHT